jgi:hypothetical protein
MKRCSILLAISLFLCSAARGQGGGGESTKRGSSKNNVTKKKTSETVSGNPEEILLRFDGKWDGYAIYYEAQERVNKRGAEQHCELIKDEKGLKFIGLDGEILSEDSVYLTYKAGKLYGSYLWRKHGGTHGLTAKRRFTLELRRDGTLVFDDSIWKHEYRKRP